MNYPNHFKYGGTFTSDLVTVATVSTNSTGLMIKTLTVCNGTSSINYLTVKLAGTAIMDNYECPRNNGVSNVLQEGYHFVPSGATIQVQASTSSTSLSYYMSGINVTS